MPIFSSVNVVEFRLLGPVEVRVATRSIDIGTPKQRAVLATLLLDVGCPLTLDTLIDRVWDQSPPPEVRGVLYAHLSRIRHLLAGLAEQTGKPMALQRRSGGYAVHVDPGLVDLHHSRDLVERSRRREQDDAERAETLHRAAALWRGDPLAGLPGDRLARVRESLRRQRLDVLLAWAQVQLRLGRPDSVVDALYPLVAEHPTVEPLPLLLMRALHAAGRTAEALDCYGATHRRLIAELGTDPGTELRALHQAILRGELDPPVDPHDAGDAGDADRAPVPVRSAEEPPAQLPPDPRGFAGRSDQLDTLDGLSLSTRDSMAIAVVAGMPGVGKTALAVHWAHRVCDRFPDGQLYVNLRGFDPGGTAVTTAEALRGFLDALRVPAQEIPTGLDAQIGLYRSLLAERQMLLVLDNARDAEQVRPLLPGARRCLVLVTSRDRLSGLVAAAGAHLMTLAPMSTSDARDLLTGRLGAARIAAEPEAADRIVSGCARLPLALSVVAARAVAHPDFPLSALAAELREARESLDVFDAGDRATDVRSVFSWSYRALHPDAARLFRLLGLHPGPDISTPAAASLAGVGVRRVRAMLAELTRAHLLTEHAPGRYVCHDLLRAYAGELAADGEAEPDRLAAIHRLLDHHLRTAHSAALMLDPQRDPIELAAPRDGVTPEPVTDHDQALAWFTAERAVLLALIRLAVDHGLDVPAWQLPWSLYTFLDYRGHWDEQAEVHAAGLVAAGRLGDLPGQAYAHRNLGAANGRLGRYDEAHQHFQQALELYQRLDRPTNQARTHLNLGWLYGLRGKFADALGHAEQARALYCAAGHRAGLAVATNSVGWYHTQLGDHEQAVRVCEQALALHEEVGDRGGLAATWDSLGFAYDQLAEHDRAAGCYRRALEVLRELGDRYNQAGVLVHLGDAYQAGASADQTSADQASADQTGADQTSADRARADRARAAWREALDILDSLGHPDADGVRARLADARTTSPYPSRVESP